MKRWIFKLAILLILGAFVNVAVAWGCAVRPYPGVFFKSGAWPAASNFMWISPNDYETNIWKRAGEIRISQYRKHLTGIRVMPLPQKINDLEYYDLLPYWSAFNLPVIYAQPKAMYFEERATGWPFLSLYLNRSQFVREYIDTPYTSHYEEYWMMKLPWNSDTWRNEIPLRPIWQGFAINTIIYAAMLWLIALCPIAARRYIRNKHGHCINCGYDLYGTKHEVCSECGHLITV